MKAAPYWSSRKPLQLAVFATLGSVPAYGWAQTTELLQVRDAGMELQVRLQAVLGDEDEATVGPNYVFDVAKDGRFLLTPYSRAAELLTFAPDGRFLGAIGRRGEGPGEYRLIRQIEVGDRYVHLLDNVQRRWTRLDPSDWTLIDTRPLPGDPHSAVVLDDSVVVMSAIVGTAEAIGFPLHRVDLNGRLVASFGAAADAPFRADMSVVAQRLLAGGENGSIWVAHATRYRIEQWDSAGTLVRAFERDVPWMRPHANPNLPDPSNPPAATIFDAHRDEASGLLWVIVGVPDPEWHEGIVRSAFQEGSGYQVGDWNAFYDTVIEVIDLELGEVIATTRVDERLWSVGGSVSATSYAEADGFYPEVSVWRLSISPQPLIEDVTSVVAAEDWSRLNELATSAPTKALQWNAQRSTIQLLGCDGLVIAQFPVPPHHVGSLSAFSEANPANPRSRR